MIYSFPFPIETGLVKAFTQAIGGDEDSLIAPPTFAMAADHFDPSFERRPQRGKPWLDTPLESLFHVEQTITLHTPLTVGLQLTAIRRPGKTWNKQGRKGGNLHFIETLTELCNARGDVLVTSSWVDVKTEHSHASLTRSQPKPTEAPQSTESTDTGDYRVSTVQVSTTQIVMYVGAAGDFHPLHHDHHYAIEQGYPGIFAPGMLTMAINIGAVSDHVGQENLSSVGGRFSAQVWPGDTLTTQITPSPQGGHELISITRNQHGTIVFEGWAKVKVNRIRL